MSDGKTDLDRAFDWIKVHGDVDDEGDICPNPNELVKLMAEVRLPLEARVKQLEALLAKQAGSWTLCTVCGATVRNAPARHIIHRIDCALAKATGSPRKSTPSGENEP